MKYKVGDKVRVRKDISVKGNWGFVEEMEQFIGKVVTISRLVDTHDDAYLILEDGGEYVWTKEIFEGLANEAPSIAKRINEKHNILNGLLNSDGSVDGEKLMEKLEENQVQITNGVLLKDRPQRPNMPASTPDDSEAKAKGSHYEKAAMQPLEVMQAIMTEEQFKGFLLGNCIKYCMRKNYKGQHDSDECKARQYAYWLELVNLGQTINPSEDKVPDSYKFKVV